MASDDPEPVTETSGFVGERWTGEPRRYTEEEKALIKAQLLEDYAARYPLTKIAERNCLNRQTVSRWLNEALSELKDPDPGRERHKDLILVDQAIRALIPGVVEGKPSSHMALNRWLERRARYLGLDEPEKLDLGGSFTGTIEEEVVALCQKLGIEHPSTTDTPD